MKKVAVIILDYKNKTDTLACIASIGKLLLNDIALSIVLVNNDTANTYTKDMFPSSFPLKLINNSTNTGYAGGNNTGMEYALSEEVEYILILNNDTIVDPSLIAQLLEVLQNNKDVGIVSPKIYFAKGNEFHTDRYEKKELGNVIWYAGGIMDWKNVLGRHRGVDEVDLGQYEMTEETDFATGCCMMFRVETIKHVGMFDERYFLYYEDSDLNERMKKKGYKIVYAPKAVLWHKNAGSTGGSGSILQDYYITRNRLLFGVRYAPLRSKLALLRESIRLLLTGRVWQKIGIKDYYVGRLGKGSYR